MQFTGPDRQWQRLLFCTINNHKMHTLHINFTARRCADFAVEILSTRALLVNEGFYSDVIFKAEPWTKLISQL